MRLLVQTALTILLILILAVVTASAFRVYGDLSEPLPGQQVVELRLKIYSYEDVTARFEIEKRYLKGIERAEEVSVEVNNRE